MTRSSKPPSEPSSEPSSENPPQPVEPTRRIHRPLSGSALGRAGEAQAARFLEARGYRIVGRNVRADRVEIDLIARRGPLLAFVEVKSRRSLRQGSAVESVDSRKQRRLRRGAAAWLATRPEAARGMRRMRFDVVTCLVRLGAGREALAPNETTAPDGTRWQIEYWEGAF